MCNSLEETKGMAVIANTQFGLACIVLVPRGSLEGKGQCPEILHQVSGLCQCPVNASGLDWFLIRYNEHDFIMRN